MFRSLLVLALAAAPAGAQTIYRWTDSKGVVHYSDDASTAPKGVKVQTTGGAELMEIKVAKTPAEKAAPRDEAAGLIPVPPPPTSDVDDEEYWRGAFAQAREKIRKLEEDLATRQKIVDDPKQLSSVAGMYCTSIKGPVGPPGRIGGPLASCWYDLKQHLPDAQQALDRAKEELADLERRAANAAVPLEWRR